MSELPSCRPGATKQLAHQPGTGISKAGRLLRRKAGGGRGKEAISVSQRHSEIQQRGEEGGRSTAASLYSGGGVVPAFVGYLSLYLFLSHRRHPINVWWMNEWLNVFPWKGLKQQNYQVQYWNSTCSHTPRLQKPPQPVLFSSTLVQITLPRPVKSG